MKKRRKCREACVVAVARIALLFFTMRQDAFFWPGVDRKYCRFLKIGAG